MQPYSVSGEPVMLQMGRQAEMEEPIDSHQWISKMEILRLLSAKPNLDTEADTQQTDAKISESGDGLNPDKCGLSEEGQDPA